MLGAEELRALQAPVGQQALDRARHLDPALPLHQAIGALRKEFPPALASAAFEMASLRRKATSKFARASEMFFTPEGLEQSTGEIPAAHRAARFAGGSAVTDLCCGIGGDTIALAAAAPVTAVDQDEACLLCCVRNLEVYGRAQQADVLRADAVTFPLRAPLLFADPSRRREGRRVRDVDEYEPPLPVVLEMAARCEGAGIKLSPAMREDFRPEQGEAEVVSLDGVCREMVLWTGRLATCARRATVLSRHTAGSFTFDTFTLSQDSAGGAVEIPLLQRLPEPGETLLEPDPAVIRAQMVGLLASRLPAQALDSAIAYLVAAEPVTTPFASSYRVLEAFRYQEKRLRQWLAARHVGHLVVKKRGFPLSPEEVTTRMRLRGRESATIVLTRRGREHVVMVVEGLRVEGQDLRP